MYNRIATLDGSFSSPSTSATETWRCGWRSICEKRPKRPRQRCNLTFHSNNPLEEVCEYMTENFSRVWNWTMSSLICVDITYRVCGERNDATKFFCTSIFLLYRVFSRISMDYVSSAYCCEPFCCLWNYFMLWKLGLCLQTALVNISTSEAKCTKT